MDGKRIRESASGEKFENICDEHGNRKKHFYTNEPDHWLMMDRKIKTLTYSFLTSACSKLCYSGNTMVRG